MAEQTETGINIETYTADRDSGAAILLKGVAGNYVYQKATVSAQIVDGLPVIVQGAPELKNINRTSLDTLKARMQAVIVHCDAMLADMDALDATVI